MTVNDPITLQDITLPEPIIVPPLQLPLDPNNVVDEIMYLREIHKKLPDLPEPQTMVIDNDVDQGLDTKTIILRTTISVKWY